MKYFLNYFVSQLKTDRSIPIIFTIILLISLIMGIIGVQIKQNIFFNILVWAIWMFVPAIIITLGMLYLKYKNKINIISIIILSSIALLFLFILISFFIHLDSTITIKIIFLFIITTTVLIGIHFFLYNNYIKDDNKCLLLENIPLPKRGELWALQAQDHYVNIITSKGTHLTLMTLTEAIKQTQNIQGEQINRSHWVAKNGLVDITKKDGKNICVLKNKMVINVSNTYLKNIKKKKWIK